MSSLQPSILNPDTSWAWFLHSTVFGAAIIKWLFSRLDAAVRKCADYRGRKNTQGFEKLEYNTE
jgi:dimethylaniline monooxygenase (N-oxide forming)